MLEIVEENPLVAVFFYDESKISAKVSNRYKMEILCVCVLSAITARTHAYRSIYTSF